MFPTDSWPAIPSSVQTYRTLCLSISGPKFDSVESHSFISLFPPLDFSRSGTGSIPGSAFFFYLSCFFLPFLFPPFSTSFFSSLFHPYFFATLIFISSSPFPLPSFLPSLFSFFLFFLVFSPVLPFFPLFFSSPFPSLFPPHPAPFFFILLVSSSFSPYLSLFFFLDFFLFALQLFFPSLPFFLLISPLY